MEATRPRLTLIENGTGFYIKLNSKLILCPSKASEKRLKNITFQIEPMNWQKRRVEKVAPPQPLSAEVMGFEFVREAKCDVFVKYDDGQTRQLKGRVIYNEIKDCWRVSAIANGGWSVYINVHEDTA